MKFGAAFWTLVVGGDIMLNAINPNAKVFEGVKAPFHEATIAYANLEIPLTDTRTPTVRKSASEVKARTQFILKAKPGHAPFLTDAGFDVLSLANNHAMDYRESGLEQMLRLLDEQEILGFGAGANWEAARRVASIQIPDGPNVGFISFLAFNGAPAMRKCTPATTVSAGIATLTITGLPDKKARALVSGVVDGAKEKCGFLVVCLHWGTERQTQPTANQVRLGRMFIDEGADVVLGSHPHVLQPGELYKGKPIIYSLGNLISPMPAKTALYRFSFEGPTVTKSEILPARISGARVKLEEGKSRDASVLRAQKAQQLLQKAHPHKSSAKLID
ncbi:MAG: CapA family protein [Fimbriimonadaceae bacterium]